MFCTYQPRVALSSHRLVKSRQLLHDRTSHDKPCLLRWEWILCVRKLSLIKSWTPVSQNTLIIAIRELFKMCCVLCITDSCSFCVSHSSWRTTLWGYSRLCFRLSSFPKIWLTRLSGIAQSTTKGKLYTTIISYR